MVNVKNLFGMAAIAAAMASCTDNDVITTNPNQNASTGKAFATFKIDLPTTSGTRADNDAKPGTPEFNGGERAEYAVNDATALIFKKNGATSEGDYTFVKSVSLGSMDPWKDNPNNTADGITTEASFVVDLGDGVSANNNAQGSDYYVLIVMNNGEENKIIYPSDGDTYADWSEISGNVYPYNYATVSDGIIMANAPKWNGSGNAPTTLVNIAGIYSTKEAAEANAATTIYVERGVAKASMQSGVSKVDGGTYDGDKVKIVHWGLDVMNQVTYPVHVTAGLESVDNGANASGSWTSMWSTPRFYDQTSSEFKRVYWGKDPNYNADEWSEDYENNFFTMDQSGHVADAPYNGDYTREDGGGDAGYFIMFDVSKSIYCLENTFDIYNQKQGQTTRAVFMAKYEPACLSEEERKDWDDGGYNGTFFKVGNNTKLLSPSMLVEYVKKCMADAYNEVCSKNIDASKVKISDFRQALVHVKEYIDKSCGLSSEDLYEPYAVESGQMDFLSICASLYDYTTIDGTELSTNPEWRIGFNKVLTDKLSNVQVYLNGISYYVARIKHFNDFYTPWAPGQPRYDGDNAKYLGRYGMVRNNWYDLTVNSISGPGSPVVPEIDKDKPDDEENSYISVNVKILDWAKRTQKVDL